MNLQEEAEKFGMKPFPGEPSKHFEARVQSVVDARKKAGGSNSWRKTYKDKL